MELEFQEATRKPFPVKVIQVTLKNIDAVAEWCKGTIELRPTKMMGTTTDLPVIKIEGQGESRGKTFEAALGCWVVELKGSFRSYKPLQFETSFDILPKKVEYEEKVQAALKELDQSRDLIGRYNEVIDANENSEDGSVQTIEIS